MEHEGKIYPDNFKFYPENKQVKSILHWEKHPNNGKEYMILGETKSVIDDFHGKQIGGERLVVSFEGKITSLAKQWFNK